MKTVKFGQFRYFIFLPFLSYPPGIFPRSSLRIILKSILACNFFWSLPFLGSQLEVITLFSFWPLTAVASPSSLLSKLRCVADLPPRFFAFTLLARVRRFNLTQQCASSSNFLTSSPYFFCSYAVLSVSFLLLSCTESSALPSPPAVTFFPQSLPFARVSACRPDYSFPGVAPFYTTPRKSNQYLYSSPDDYFPCSTSHGLSTLVLPRFPLVVPKLPRQVFFLF